MNDVNELKKTLAGEVVWSTKNPPVLGGQSCGAYCPAVVLTHEGLDIKITIGYHRGQLRNKELAMTLFELALDDIIT